MDKPIIRGIREDDIRDFYGENYRQACRGWAIEYRGKLAAIVGVTIMPTIMIAWSDIKADVRASRRVVYETAQRIMKLISELGYPVIYAVASYDLKNAPAFLHRLGWEFMEDSARGRIFRWRS